ncbi:GyrI-like domain-containing protein [Bdellovibrio sp. HCB209]|uniref:GyrI-like domain-containing protein n=1 Tax=Bdellovibrio sp. HCB209 TaxID=3394354 RepID=UPI0039B417FC
MRYILVFVVVMVISFGTYLATYLGAFKGVEISEVKQGPFKTIYIEHVGPYHKVNKVIGRVEAFMASQGTVCQRTFGEYLDNPREVEEARLRAKVGCLIETMPANAPEEMKEGEIPARDYVQAVFTGSPGIGPLKVYPRVEQYMEQKKLKQAGAGIEIYEIHSITEKAAMTTTYLFPVIPE